MKLHKRKFKGEEKKCVWFSSSRKNNILKIKEKWLKEDWSKKKKLVWIGREWKAIEKSIIVVKEHLKLERKTELERQPKEIEKKVLGFVKGSICKKKQMIRRAF